MTLRDKFEEFGPGFGVWTIERMLRTCLILGFVGVAFGLYGWSQFRGFRDPEAMEYAQLARRLSEGKGFTTQCVRPGELGYLSRAGRAPSKNDNVPDIRHTPLFPYLEAQGLRVVKPSFNVRPGMVFTPEKAVIVPLCALFALGAGLFVFLAASRLFEPRVAVAATAVFFVTEAVPAGVFAGTPLTLRMFLCAASLYAAVVAVTNKREDTGLVRWIVPALLSAALCGLAALSGYVTALALTAVLALFLATGLGRSGRFMALAATLIVAAMLAPWLARNRQVSGGLLGVAPYAALDGDAVCQGDTFDRCLQFDARRAPILRAIKAKLVAGIGGLHEDQLRAAGGGLLMTGFFLVSFFCRFERDEANRLRWCLLAGLGVVLAAAALGVGETGENARIFLPFTVVFGTALFFALMDNSGFVQIGWEGVLSGVMVILCAAPTLATITTRRPGFPYPPYYPPFVSLVSGMLEPKENLCTDIPWATAWYGNRFSVLLPRTIEDFQAIHRDRFPLSALYLTTETTDRPYTSGLQEGTLRAWLPVINGAAPADFPLRHGITLPAGTREQIFLADRVRWK